MRNAPFQRHRLLPWALLAAAPGLSAVELPYSFEAHTPAVAGEVAANFEALRSALAAADARIEALEAELAQLHANNHNLTALQDHVALVIDSYGHNTVRFTGVNLQVVNGQGATSLYPQFPTEANVTEHPNGVGNVIIGYNEPRTEDDPHCSFVPWDIARVAMREKWEDQVECEAAGYQWAVDHKSGSHNLVIGGGNSYSSYGGLIQGEQNAVNGQFATAVGGRQNRATGGWSSVTGGSANLTLASYSNISGGAGNVISGQGTGIADAATIAGGWGNTVTCAACSILGGWSRTLSDDSYQTLPPIPEDE